MGKLVYVMGKSGTGKSTSMEKLPADQFGLINPEGKDLPFGKDAPAFRVERVVTDKSDQIVEQIKRFAKKYKIIVVDDFQTVMTNEYMRRSAETGYQKWTDIAKHVWEIAESAKDLPDDRILYVLCHVEENENGGEKIKTLGKLLDQSVVLESKSTIVLKTGVEDGKYYFFTQNNGKDTVKSPKGMFPSYSIQNDLKYVDDTIRNYYDLPGAKSDQEIQQEHEAAAGDVEKPAGRKSRSRAREEVKAANEKAVQETVEAQAEAIDKIAGDRDEVPWEEAAEEIDKFPMPEPEKVPRRTRAKRSVEPDPDPAVLTGDTYFYVEATDNYVLKHAGDTAPEGGKEITADEFGEGIRRIAMEKDAQPAPTRRRRTRS